MECAYCYANMPFARDEGRHQFCHKNCCLAFTREIIENNMDTLKPLLKSSKGLALRWFKTVILFQTACLKRSSKQQLSMIKEKVNEASIDLLDDYSRQVSESKMPENQYLAFSNMTKQYCDQFDEYIHLFGI